MIAVRRDLTHLAIAAAATVTLPGLIGRAAAQKADSIAPPGGKPRLELIGELSAMLRTAGVDLSIEQQKGPVPGGMGPDLLSSVKGDAGTGFEPVTFRL